MLKALISDADGTLVNTLFLIRHGQYEAVIEYLAEKGVPRSQLPTYDVYRERLDKSVGGPTKETISKTIDLLTRDFAELRGINVEPEVLDKMLRPIQDRFAPLYVSAYDGLLELLHFLGENDIKLAIYSSGYKHHIVRNFGVALPELGLEELYKKSASDDEKLTIFTNQLKKVTGISEITTITAEDVKVHKPDPEGIHLALKRLGIKKNEAIVFGDHIVDMQMAQGAGVRAIGITHGFSTKMELEETGASDICHSLVGLVTTLQKTLRMQAK